MIEISMNEINYDNCHDANKYELNKRKIIDLDKQLNDREKIIIKMRNLLT
jgi:hypothetical protein